mgnify:CR=1 FL=1
MKKNEYDIVFRLFYEVEIFSHVELVSCCKYSCRINLDYEWLKSKEMENGAFLKNYLQFWQNWQTFF